jgi:hypothetical protein
VPVRENPAISDLRLTGEQCQEIADRTMRSVDSLDAEGALARFTSGAIDVAADDLTGKPFRRVIAAHSIGNEVVILTVVVTAEPRLVRRARRFKWIAALFARNPSMGQTSTVLSRDSGEPSYYRRFEAGP